MNENSQIMHSVWNNYQQLMSKEAVGFHHSTVDELMSSFFCPGPYYYYVIDFTDRKIKYANPTVTDILGVEPHRLTFDDVLTRVHPDDIDFVSRAEQAAYEFVQQLGWQQLTNYKAGYCFRLRKGNGSYSLFQHQAIPLRTDTSGGIGPVLNIHTDISHITTHNNQKISIAGILGRNDFYVIDPVEREPITSQSSFTRREVDILRLISQGYKNETIAALLHIASNTVKTHRKNILKKAGAQSTSELIGNCVRLGII